MILKTAFDVELLAKELGYMDMELLEAVDQLRTDTITEFVTRRHEIKELLWDEKLDDVQGLKFHAQNQDQLCESIIAIHKWQKEQEAKP